MTDRELYPGVHVRCLGGHRIGQVGVVEGLQGPTVLVRWSDRKLSSILAIGLKLVHDDDEDTPVVARAWEDES